MKFSISLPKPEDNDGFDDLIELARAAERIGFEAVSASDHPFPLVVEGEAGHQAYDPFVLLSYVGAATERVKLHFSLVIAGYRNPFGVARTLGTLDYASGGRVIAGLGAGYLKAEFDAMGGDYNRRGPAVDEAVHAIRAAWTGQPVTMSTADWTATGNVMLPAPSSAPIRRCGGAATRARRSCTRSGTLTVGRRSRSARPAPSRRRPRNSRWTTCPSRWRCCVRSSRPSNGQNRWTPATSAPVDVGSTTRRSPPSTCSASLKPASIGSSSPSPARDSTSGSTGLESFAALADAAGVRDKVTAELITGR